MNFPTAVRTALGKYAVFSGRARRSEYWWFTLFNILVSAVADAITLATHSSVPTLLVTLALFLPALGVTVRRLHDTGRSGWWVLIGIVPIVGGIVLLVFTCQDSEGGEPTKYGPSPKYSPQPAGLSTPFGAQA